MTAGERSVPIPTHRLRPLREHWTEIYEPIVRFMKLDIRYNAKRRCVELRTNSHTTDPRALQRSADFIKAFTIGFEVRDAAAMLRLDDLVLDGFDVDEVKMLEGESLSRAIGRIAGSGGKVRYTLENSTMTRIVIHDKHVAILGSYQNARIARQALQDIVLGAPPSKIFARLQARARNSS